MNHERQDLLLRIAAVAREVLMRYYGSQGRGAARVLFTHMEVLRTLLDELDGSAEDSPKD